MGGSRGRLWGRLRKPCPPGDDSRVYGCLCAPGGAGCADVCADLHAQKEPGGSTGRRARRVDQAGHRAMINVITIDREYGSGGSDIARKLGERLEWPVWGERLTNGIARPMECDTRSVAKVA